MHYLQKLEPPMSEEEPRDDEPDSDSVLGLKVGPTGGLI